MAHRRLRRVKPCKQTFTLLFVRDRTFSLPITQFLKLFLCIRIKRTARIRHIQGNPADFRLFTGAFKPHRSVMLQQFFDHICTDQKRMPRYFLILREIDIPIALRKPVFFIFQRKWRKQRHIHREKENAIQRLLSCRFPLFLIIGKPQADGIKHFRLRIRRIVDEMDSRSRSRRAYIFRPASGNDRDFMYAARPQRLYLTFQDRLGAELHERFEIPHPRGSPRRRDQGVKYIILSFIHLSVAKGNLQKFFLFPILPATDQCPEPTRVPDYQNIAPALHPEFIPGCPGAPCTIRKTLSLRRSEIVHICPSCHILRWKLFPDFIEGMTIPFPHVNLRQTIYDLNRNTSVNHFLQDRS